MTAPTVATAGAYLILDQAYRAAVAQTAIKVVRLMQIWWTTLDAEDLVGTSGRWLDASVAAVLAGQTTTANLADAYTQQVRRLSIPGAEPWTPPARRPGNDERIRKSLIFTGLHQTGERIALLDSPSEDIEATSADRESDERTKAGRRDQLMNEGIARAAGSAARLLTDAGQERIYDNVVSDPVAIGWARTTKPGCCYFCAMLASRGHVYKEDSFEESNERFIGPGEHKIHDHCGCGLRPLYSRDDPEPDRNEALSQLWADEAAKFSGHAAIKAFRNAYAASPLSRGASSV